MDEVEPRKTLAELLRYGFRLTGTHIGCEHGVCGACTILVDGAAVRSCLMLAVQADGTRITTVEALADGVELGPLHDVGRLGHFDGLVSRRQVGVGLQLHVGVQIRADSLGAKVLAGRR